MKITLVVAALCLLALGPAIPRLPAAEPWQAGWIGLAASPAPDLTRAFWIWADSPGVDPTRNAKPGTGTFRREIELPADAVVSSASVSLVAHDRFKLTLNGKVLGEGTGWQKPVVLEISVKLKRGPNPRDTYFDTMDLAPYLREGENTVAPGTWTFEAR